MDIITTYAPDQVADAIENPRVGDTWRTGEPGTRYDTVTLRVLHVRKRNIRVMVNEDYSSTRGRANFRKNISSPDAVLLQRGEAFRPGDPPIGSVWKSGTITRQVNAVDAEGIEFDQKDQFGYHPFCKVSRKAWKAWADKPEAECIWDLKE